MNFIKKIILLFLPLEKRLEAYTKEELKKLKVIDSNSDGFSITSYGPKVLMESWNSIEDIKIQGNKILIYKGKKLTHKLLEEYSGWHQLIQNVPKGFKSYDYSFIQEYLDKLIGCEVCGSIAVKNTKCLACGTDIWKEDFLIHYDSKKDYIKQEQIDLLEPNNEHDKIDIRNKLEPGFKIDPNWKPIIN